MKGRMRPYLPELTIRDYNTYMRYLRGVRRQMHKSYGFYACHLLRTNGVLFAILSDSLAGRMPTCKRQRVPGTPFRRSMMCQTLGIRQAAQTEILMGWHNLQDRKYSELRPVKRLRRAADKLLLRRAYEKASICWTRPSALKPTAATASTTCSWSTSSTGRLLP